MSRLSDRHSEAARRNLAKALAARRAALVPHVCTCCGAARLIPQSVAAKGRRFCGWACRQRHMRGDQAPNAGGGQWMEGAANPNWKGGTADRRRERHTCGEEFRWRRRVFHRDGYSCQRCGLSPRGPGQLNAHHVIPWAACPESRHDTLNGVTLCVPCHRWVHGRANTAKEYLACPIRPGPPGEGPPA